MTSPAAVIAIGSGTALIFLQATFQEWFSLKMLLVGGMVMLHVVAGLVLAHLFLPDGRFGLFPAHCTDQAPILVLMSAIIWIVLAKPHIDSSQFAPGLFEPGKLRQLFSDTRNTDAHDRTRACLHASRQSPSSLRRAPTERGRASWTLAGDRSVRRPQFAPAMATSVIAPRHGTSSPREPGCPRTSRSSARPTTLAATPVPEGNAGRPQADPHQNASPDHQ